MLFWYIGFEIGYFCTTLEYAVLRIFEDMQTSGICGVANDGTDLDGYFGSNDSAYWHGSLEAVLKWDGA